MKGILLLAIIAVVAFAAASSGGSSKSASTTPTTAPKAADPQPTTVHKSSNKACGQTLANSHTSCAFAEAVYAAYVAAVQAQHSPPEHVNAYSTVTHQWYEPSCGVQSTVVRCSTGSALVSFSYPTEPQQPTAASEEDEVGSTSHATDEQFCQEHECIGSFTTEDGTVVECSDGTYSHAGGISGACSDHGGESSPSSEEESGRE
jgi:hypothetical protein